MQGSTPCVVVGSVALSFTILVFLRMLISNLSVRLNLEDAEVRPMKKRRLASFWSSIFNTLWAIGASAIAGARTA